MRYEWDDHKDRLNQKRHGISFATAASALEDPNCLLLLDRVDDTGEQRWHAIGAVALNTGGLLVLVVVHVYREEVDGEEITRIISARRADKNEFRRYQELQND